MTVNLPCARSMARRWCYRPRFRYLRCLRWRTSQRRKATLGFFASQSAFCAASYAVSNQWIRSSSLIPTSASASCCNILLQQGPSTPDYGHNRGCQDKTPYIPLHPMTRLKHPTAIACCWRPQSSCIAVSTSSDANATISNEVPESQETTLQTSQSLSSH